MNELESFSRKVTSAAQRAKSFGENKAFIGSTRRLLGTDPQISKLSRADFNRKLVKAHQRGLLTLSRADLVSAMDKFDVKSSTVSSGNAEFHFIQKDSTVNSKTRAALISKIDREIEKKVTSEMATRKPAKKRRAKKRAKTTHHAKRPKTKRASKKRKSHKREATVTLEGLRKGQYKTWTCKGRVRSGCGGGGRVVH